jgi:preprotein translocase subunit SecB
VTKGTPEPELQPYPVQLIAAHCVECSAERRPHPPDEPPEPKITAELSRTDLVEDGRAFGARLTVGYAVAAPGNAVADLRVVVQGSFSTDEPMNAEQYEAFAAYTPVALLWPYARAYLSDLARMLGLTIAPLPTLPALPPLQTDEDGEQQGPQEAK